MKQLIILLLLITALPLRAQEVLKKGESDWSGSIKGGLGSGTDYLLVNAEDFTKSFTSYQIRGRDVLLSLYYKF